MDVDSFHFLNLPRKSAAVTVGESVSKSVTFVKEVRRSCDIWLISQLSYVPSSTRTCGGYIGTSIEQ